jgi:hypothetical protein
VRPSNDEQGKEHRAGVPWRHLRLDELVCPGRELADTVAGRAVALRCSLEGHPGAVAETSDPEPAAGGALKGPDGVALWRSSLLGAVRARMRLGLVRVEGVR